MNMASEALNILYVIATVEETSCPYNELSRPLSAKHNITLCSYFKAMIVPAPGITLFEGDGTLWGFFRALKAALDARKYDVIHGHMAANGVLFLLANALLRRTRNATVFTVHNCYQNYKFRNRLLLLPVFLFYRRVICCSRAALESFPAIYKRLAGKRLTSVQNGVNMERIDLNLKDKLQNRENDRFTVLSVGRLIPIKNTLTLLKAFHQSIRPTSRLVYVGDGYLQDRLQDEVNALGLESQVELTGLIPRDKVFDALAQADLFVSTSYGEGLPVAVLEAMACRCPVILSDIQPHREIATGTDFIPLVPADDTDGFAREINRYQNLPAHERKAIGEKCRRWVEEHFSLSAMHRGYINVYRDLIAQPAE